MGKNIVLAIDQSTTATGWAVFFDKVLVEHGVYSPKGTRDERIDSTKNWLKDKITELAEKGEVTLAFEDIQMQSNVETFKSLAQLQGVIINAAYNKEFEEKLESYISYFASAWKSTCKVKGIKRKEQKENAQKFVLREFKITAPEDACDAICIGYHHINSTTEEINFE